MAHTLAILTTLTTLFLFSGCIGDDAAPATLDETDVPAAETTQPPVNEPPAAAPAAPDPGCLPHNNSNSGIWTQTGDLYVISPYDGKLLVAYKESNGVRGIQTEAQCPKNPDTKLAEVPYPIVAGTSLNA